jgi:hypothetical protein
LEGQALAEIAVVQGSVLDHVTLRQVRFLDRFQLAVVAIHRAGREVLTPSEEIRDVTLAPGDILLVQGAREHIRALNTPDFLVPDAIACPALRAPLALSILGAVALAALDILPIAVSAPHRGHRHGRPPLDIPSALRRSHRPCSSSSSRARPGRALIETGATNYVTEVLPSRQAHHPSSMSGPMALPAIPRTDLEQRRCRDRHDRRRHRGASRVTAGTVRGSPLRGKHEFLHPIGYQTNLLATAGNYRFAECQGRAAVTLILWLTLTWLLDASSLTARGTGARAGANAPAGRGGRPYGCGIPVRSG